MFDGVGQPTDDACRAKAADVQSVDQMLKVSTTKHASDRTRDGRRMFSSICRIDSCRDAHFIMLLGHFRRLCKQMHSKVHEQHMVDFSAM